MNIDDPQALGSFADACAKAIEQLLNDSHNAAEGQLRPFAAFLQPCAKRRSIPLLLQARVFLRDHFMCRYCGRRTIFPPVLRLLSTIHPDIIPYHPHGKMAECHIAFWRDISSCDHIIPVARGGSSEINNLVTACYKCNSIKQNWLLDELQWTLHPIQVSDWDGLSTNLDELRRLSADGQNQYYKSWSKALQRALINNNQ